MDRPVRLQRRHPDETAVTFADIATANTEAAEICFLIALILAALAALAAGRPTSELGRWVTPLASAAVAALALGFLLL